MAKRISEIPISKPQYKKQKSLSIINSAIKSDFSPVTDSPTDIPSMKKILSSLYPSMPKACAFHYVTFENKANYSPEDDINVDNTVEIEATPCVPKSILEVLSTVENQNDLIQKLSEITQEEVDALEKCTRGQNSNNQWKDQRFGRITASTCHRVMTKVHTLKTSSKPVDCTSLLSSLCPSTDNADKKITSKALMYGINMEEEARTAYVKEVNRQKHNNINVSSSGLFVLSGMSYIGASPDGLVDCTCCGQGLLEIKCPLSVSHATPNSNNLPYLLSNDKKEIHLSKSHLYYSQVQQQMGVTGRKWCDFFVYSRHGFHLERIYFDSERWAKLKDAAEFFFKEHIAPFLLQIKVN